jgi:hypothetical protein
VAAAPIIVIWMLASELSTAGTVAMTNAAREALGKDAELRVQAAPDPEGMRLSDVGTAAGTVRVSWDSSEHRRARLLVYLPASERWLDRELSFKADDPEVERGRALGFVVASIFLDAGAVPRPNSGSESARAPTRASQKSAQAANAGTRRASAPSTSLSPSPPPSGPDTSPANAALTAAATIVGPGTATAFGAWLSGSRWIAGGLWLGVAGQARLGEIPEARASSRFLAAGVNATWQFWHLSQNSWLGVRGSAAVAQLALSHFSSDDAVTVRRARVLPVFELALHAGYRLGVASALVLDFGAEMVPGSTDIYVRNERVASWSPFVGVVRLGVQTSF